MPFMDFLGDLQCRSALFNTIYYLGTEDAYGYSWGFKGTHSDHYMAIIRKENLQPAGSLIAMLRCRAADMISFQKSCRWLLTFATDPGHQKSFQI
jgi:hypothetical protein